MEYQQKKEQILGSVEYSNLLTFTLAENKLERNFRSIVEALLLNQSKTDELGTRTDQLEEKSSFDRQKDAQEIECLKQALKQLNDRISKL